MGFEKNNDEMRRAETFKLVKKTFYFNLKNN